MEPADKQDGGSGDRRPGAEARFVIQHHRTRDAEHWDLMLETGPVLATWQLWRHPATYREGPIAATRIGDHRKMYLTYEGPLSGDRGSVQILDQGTYRLREQTADHLVVELNGRLVCGTFELRHGGLDTGQWVFEQAR